MELTINEKLIKTENGATILQAALKNGIYIPNLCFDKRLKPFGGCRLCVVEVEGEKKLLAACSTPAKEGMTVHTETQRLAKARKTVLELLLVHHPLDCPICDKAGECALQDLAFKYGPSQSRFTDERKHELERIDSPIVERNPNRCILCGKCVRLCYEHQGVGAINFIKKGFETKISPAFEETLDCEFCGQCIDTCPVGALGSKPYKFQARAWFIDEHEITCPFCGCGCTTNLSLREGEIIRARGKEGVGINSGDLCTRGRFGFDYIYSENRLTQPMIKKDGTLTAVSWKEALDFITEKLDSIKAHYGPSAIGAIGSQRCTMEDNYMLQLFMRDVIGTDNIDSAARFGYAKAQKAIESAFGIDDLPITWDAPLKADFILIVESDITSTLPVWGLNFILAKYYGKKLVVADSKETKLARNSKQWVRLKPGTGVALLKGMMKVIIDEGLYDMEKASSTYHFNTLVSSLFACTPAAVSEITGVPEADIVGLARAYAASKRRLISVTSNASENTTSLNTILAAANLVNLMGDSPETLQAPAEFSNTLGMWMMGVRPLKGGKDLQEMIYKSDDIKSLYIMGENPVVTFPDVAAVEKRLKALELLVVQDISLTKTAKLADVILPACSWAEKEGTFMSATGATHKIPKLVSERGQSVPDWMIFRNLARVMNKDLGVKGLDEIKLKIKELLTSGEKKRVKPSFNLVEYDVIEKTDEEYPLSLVTANVLQHSGSLSVLSKNLDSVVSDAYLQINMNDAEKYGVEHGGFVKVESKRGHIYLKAVITDEVPEGAVFASVHFAHARINTLTYPSVNGGVPLVAVKIEGWKK
ncbi:MAG TPA: molybdopterin-dependent oxidoreductase [Dissulfurispiraceae bacterium]|nr:molybdopterin-dependent oxidoreductase [Dissulfurispiraceae bacterium]